MTGYVTKDLSHRRFVDAKVSVLAHAVLALYLITTIVFALSTLRMTYPVVTELALYEQFQSLVVALSMICIIAKAPRIGGKFCMVLALSFAALFASSILASNHILLLGYMVLLAVIDEDIFSLMRVFYCTVIITLCVILLLGTMGVLYNREHLLDDALRFPCGILHPNNVGSLLFGAFTAMVIERWNKRTWPVVLVLILFSFCFCHFILSSEGSAATLLFLLLVTVVGHLPFMRLCKRFLGRAGFIVCIILPIILCAFMIVFTIYYKDLSNYLPVEKINELFHGRLFFSNNYYTSKGGLAVFGRSYSYSPDHHTGVAFSALDSSYSNLAMVFGVSMLIVFGINYYTMIRRVNRTPQCALLFALIIVYCLYGVIESYPIYLYTNPCMLLLTGQLVAQCADAEERAVEKRSKRVRTPKGAQQSVPPRHSHPQTQHAQFQFSRHASDRCH